MRLRPSRSKKISAQFSKSTTPTKISLRPTWEYIGVLVSILLIFLVVPLFLKTYYEHIGLQFCFVALVLAAIYTLNNNQTTHRKFDLYLELTLGSLFIFFDLWSIYADSLLLMAVAYCFNCLFLFFAIIALAKRVLSTPVIDTNLIFGGISIYLFAGIFWAKLYFLIYVFNPHSFMGVLPIDIYSRNLEAVFNAQFDLLYYSFTTICTLGVGDIFPVDRLPKSLSVLEAMFGQLFIAIVISKLVSVWRR